MIKFLNAGDKGLIVEFGLEISPQLNQKVRGLLVSISENYIDGIIEMIPTYRSLLVEYDPKKIRYEKLVEKIENISNNMQAIQLPPANVVEIPTCYGGEYGPDLAYVAKHCNMTEVEVINIHSSTPYLIYMLGFSPGFTFLGGMDEKIATPRLLAPRPKIRGGSVGIAGKQTGMYALDTPGGWQLIGLTPLKLYDEDRQPPILYNAGDYIQYVSINEDEFEQIQEEQRMGTYKWKIYPMNGGKLNG